VEKVEVEGSGNRRERGEERRGILERVRLALEVYRMIILIDLKLIRVKQGEWKRREEFVRKEVSRFNHNNNLQLNPTYFEELE